MSQTLAFTSSSLLCFINTNEEWDKERLQFCAVKIRCLLQQVIKTHKIGQRNAFVLPLAGICVHVWTWGSGVVTAFDKDREGPVKKAPGNHLSHTIPGSWDQKVSATISQDTVPFTVVSAVHNWGTWTFAVQYHGCFYVSVYASVANDDSLCKS